MYVKSKKTKKKNSKEASVKLYEVGEVENMDDLLNNIKNLQYQLSFTIEGDEIVRLS